MPKPKTRTLKGGGGKRACAGWARAGLVVRFIPRSPGRRRFRVRAGPRSNHRTLSDFQSAECVNSPAHFKGSCGVSPLWWVWRRPPAGSDQGGHFLPQKTTGQDPCRIRVSVFESLLRYQVSCPQTSTDVRIGPLGSGYSGEAGGNSSFRMIFASVCVRFAPYAASRGVRVFWGYLGDN